MSGTDVIENILAEAEIPELSDAMLPGIIANILSSKDGRPRQANTISEQMLAGVQWRVRELLRDSEHLSITIGSLISEAVSQYQTWVLLDDGEGNV